MTAQETVDNVEKALEEIRPFLMSDGGNIKLLSIEDEIVKIQLEGAKRRNVLLILLCTESYVQVLRSFGHLLDY